MAESDLNKYLRELMTGGRPDLGLITSRRNPMAERQSSVLQTPVAQPQAGRRFNYDSPVGAVPQSSDPGGFRGFLGDVAGVGRSALGLGLKSLGPLDWARRASLATLSEFDKLGRDDSFEFGDSGLANFGESVVETAFDLPTKLSGYDYLPAIVDNIREMRGIEAVDPVDRETVDERSWWEKFNDPNFGYGEILHDKSGGGLENALQGTRVGEIAGSVGDKAIGFAGDVIYDPTSYVTGGATAIAGKLNRFAAAAEIASKVGRVPGVTEEMVGRMASRGASAFTDAERALIDLPQLYQRGLRVGNPLGGKNTVRIPGTAQIDRLFSALVREPRHYVTSSKAYRKVVEARRAPQGQELMFDVLRRGKPDAATGVTPMQAAIALDAHNALKAAENLYKTQWSQGAAGVFEGMDVESRRALTAATEQGQSDLTPLFQQIRDNLKAEGVDIGDITSLSGVDGYMPHVRTRAMTELMDPSKTSPDVAAAFNKAFKIDPTKRQSMTLRRTILPGTTMKFNLGGEAVEITFERATIAEINEKLTEAFPQFGITKWLEDDAAILFSRYIDEAARSAGQVRMFERLLDVAPDQLVNRLHLIGTEVIDEVRTKMANAEAAAHLGEVIKAREEQIQQRAAELIADADQMQGMFVDAMQENLRGLGHQGQVVAASLEKAKARKIGLKEAQKVIREKFAAQREALTAARKEAETAFDLLSGEADRLRVALASGVDPSGAPWSQVVRDELRKAQGDRSVVLRRIEQLRDARAKQIAEMDETFKALEDITEQINYTVFVRDQIEEALDDPAELRRILEEEDGHLFEEYLRETKVWTKTESPAQVALVDARKALDDAERSFDEFVNSKQMVAAGDSGSKKLRKVPKGVLARAVAEEQNAARSARLFQFSIQHNRKRVRELWDSMDAPTRRAQEMLVADARAPHFERLNALVRFAGASSYEVDSTTGRLRLLFDADEREFAYGVAQEFKMNVKANRALQRALRAELEAAEQAEKTAKSLAAKADGKSLPSPAVGGAEFFVKATKRLQKAIDAIADDLSRAEAATVAARISLDAAQQDDPVRWMAARFDEVFNAGVEDKIDFSKWLSDGIIQIERSTVAGAKKSIEQMAESLYAQAKKAADDAARDVPGARQYLDLLEAQANYRKARLGFDAASKHHRRAKDAHQKLLRQIESGDLEDKYLGDLRRAVRRAEERVAREGKHIDAVEYSIYDYDIRPIVEGAEAGRLPYEREAIERARTVQAASVPLEPTGDVVKALEGGPAIYELEIEKIDVLPYRPLSAEEFRRAELKRMTPEERRIYGGTDTIDEDFVEESGDSLDNMFGVGDDVVDEAADEAPRRAFGDQTLEERMANLEKGRRNTALKTELLEKIGKGDVTPLEAWRLATTNEAYKNLKLRDVLANLPGSSNIRALRVMHEMGIMSNRNLRALRVDDARIGPKKLREAVGRVNSMPAVASVDPGTADSMILLVERIHHDGVVPPEIEKRMRHIASRFSDQDLTRRGLHAAVVRDEKLLAYYKGRLERLVPARDAIDYREGTDSKLLQKYERLNTDIVDIQSAIAILDQEALLRKRMVSQKTMSLVEMQELRSEFNDLIDWSNRYVRAVDAGASEGDQLAARVTAEVYKRRMKATKQRIDSKASNRFKVRRGTRMVSASDEDLIVDRALEDLLPQLDVIEMIDAERRQLRRHIRAASQDSKRRIEGLADPNPRSLKDDLIDAGLREEDDFVSEGLAGLTGRATIDYSETSGFSITYNDFSAELKQEVEELGRSASRARQDLAVSLGKILAVGESGGADLVTKGNIRKEFLKELRKGFRSGGSEGAKEVIRRFLPQMRESSKASLLHRALQGGTSDRALLQAQERIVEGLGARRVGTKGSRLQELAAAEKRVAELEAEIAEAVKKDPVNASMRSPVSIQMKRKRLEVAKQAVKRLRESVDEAPSVVAGRPVISQDWRDVMGVAPEGYVSPLALKNDNWDLVYNSYNAKRAELELQLADWNERLRLLEQGDVSPARSRAMDAGVVPTVPQQLMRDLDRLSRGIDATDASIAAAQADVAALPSLRDVTRSVRQQQQDMLDKANLLDDSANRMFQRFDDIDRQLQAVDPQEAAEIMDVEQLVLLEDFNIAAMNARSREIEGSIKSKTGRRYVESQAKKFAAKDLSKKNIDEIQAEFDGLLGLIDERGVYGDTAAWVYRKYVDDVAKYNKMLDTLPNLSALRSKAQQNDLHQVFKYKANKGFIEMGEILGKENMIAVAEPLGRMINNIEKSMNTGAFIETIELANRFFKTYATLTPGFHVRNWMGASYMNLSEGVEIRNTREAYRIAAKYREDANGYIDSLRVAARNGDSQAIRELDALEAAFGSGASGRLDFGEIGKANAQSDLVRRVMDTKGADALLANKVVRLSQSVGTNWVELPARMALALDSFDRGMSRAQAIARIKRVHFDYSELSKFDQKMKALIPFWVFMSRNLPLQMQQILLKPKMYTAYNSLIRNFSADNQDMLQWQEERNGWVLFNNSTMFGGTGSNIAILPDLQHVSMIDDLEKADPTSPLRFLSQMNPLVRVPAELTLDKQFYKDRPFYPGENKGQYAALQTVPQIGQAARLAGVGPYEDRSRLQSWLNFFGVPLYEVPEERLQREQRRR